MTILQAGSLETKSESMLSGPWAGGVPRSQARLSYAGHHSMTTYFIGRSPDPKKPRIVLDDQTVSGRHGCLSDLGDGTYTLEDSNSTNGTYIRDRGGWRRINSANVRGDDEIRLGRYVTTVADLLRRAETKPARFKLVRNPKDGGIETKGV
jgi:pSer/pThr/pTyr-binding forkhead associated (FHA) protein